MPWLIPSIIATMAGTAILVICYFYLYVNDGKKYLKIWAIGWAVYFARFFFLLAMVLWEKKPILLIGNQLTSLISGVLLLYGSYLFINKTFPRRILIFASVIGLWIITSITMKMPFFIMALPTFSFLAATYIWTGILFYRVRGPKTTEEKIVGSAFILWGLHKGDYPFIKPILWLAPWGYLLSACLEFIVALGLLMVYFKKTKTELKANEDRFKTLIKKSPLPMAVTRTDDNVSWFNDKFIDSFGYTLDEVQPIERWWEKAYPDEAYREKVQQTWNDAIETARINNTDVSMQEWEITIKNGTKRTCEFYMVPLDNMGLVIMKDVTEQKRTENQLRQSQKIEAIGRLAGGVAHDFNNMLSIILGNIELLLEDAQLPPLQKDNLHEIQSAAERSAELTRQLLAFARKQAIAPEILNLNKTLESMLGMLSRLIGENITLQWQPAKTLWSVEIDPSQVDQIIANLCVNARDSIQGTGTITIATNNITIDNNMTDMNSELTEGEYVLLMVSDTGCGMDKEAIENLFEPFYTTKDVGKGTGLGLATIYGIVKQNKGFINVYSEINQGTVIRIYLPRYFHETGKAPKKVLDTNVLTGDEVILLVEDETAILKMTTKILERLGYTVLAFSSPDEAIGSAGSYDGKIDLLMTDVVMPEMSGKTIADKLLESRPGMACLYMSGYTKDIIAHHGVLDKGLNFIEKPFSKSQLATKIREILDR